MFFQIFWYQLFGNPMIIELCRIFRVKYSKSRISEFEWWHSQHRTFLIVLPQIRISLLWCTICQIIRFANHDSWISRAICVLFMGLFGSWSFHYYPNHDPDNRIFWTGLSIYLLYQFYLFIVLIVIYLFISYIQLSCFKSPTLPGIEPRKLNWKSGVGASCYKTLLWDK